MTLTDGTNIFESEGSIKTLTGAVVGLGTLMHVEGKSAESIFWAGLSF